MVELWNGFVFDRSYMTIEMDYPISDFAPINIYPPICLYFRHREEESRNICLLPLVRCHSATQWDVYLYVAEFEELNLVDMITYYEPTSPLIGLISAFIAQVALPPYETTTIPTVKRRILMYSALLVDILQRTLSKPVRLVEPYIERVCGRLTNSLDMAEFYEEVDWLARAYTTGWVPEIHLVYSRDKRRRALVLFQLYALGHIPLPYELVELIISLTVDSPE